MSVWFEGSNFQKRTPSKIFVYDAEDVLEAGENCMGRSFIICTDQMSLWPTNQREWDGQDMWHAWGNEKCVVIVRKHKRTKPLGRPKHRPQETLNGSFLTNRKWIGLTCHRTRISSGILRVAQNAWNLLTSWATISFSRKDSAPCGYFRTQGVDSHAVYTVR